MTGLQNAKTAGAVGQDDAIEDDLQTLRDGLQPWRARVIPNRFLTRARCNPLQGELLLQLCPEVDPAIDLQPVGDTLTT